MSLFLLILSVILGLCIGSFLNVVIFRYGTGISPFTGRSKCQVCDRELVWYELIPVVSYLVLHGQCRTCKTKISYQYAIVELISGALFGLVFIRQYALYNSIYSAFPHGLLYSLLFLLFYFIIISVLLVIAVYDLRHKIIPNGLVYTFIVLSVAKLLLFYFISSGVSPFTFPFYMDVLAPILLFVPFWFLWAVSRGTWIGFGDAKLAVGIGALLGFVSGLSAIVLGFWIGAVVCLALIIIQKYLPNLFGPLHAKSEIPLAPFLILGTLIVLFWRVDALGIAAYFTV